MRPGDYITLVVKRAYLAPIISGLGCEAERWKKRANTLKPNGEPWSDAVKRASFALEVKEQVLKAAGDKLTTF